MQFFMSEQQQAKQIFTLSQVAKSIRKTINERYKSAYWIKAELNKLNHYRHSGHCYPDLVEKDGRKITAQLRAILWKDDYRNINQRFINILNEPLKEGIKILFYARITFDPVYGLSLRILDIDPSFTLGDLEREKQECIKQLRKEGLFDLNKKLQLPLLPQRIAIISVETSKGYADFIRIIEGNPWHYKFFHILFPAFLQGDKAVYSIINQLQNISRIQQHFDMVAIIRGGGGEVGLSSYNQYNLARAVSKFPLPVFTGIGHATNETVTEMVAYANEITPTKLAESLIQHFHNFATVVEQATETINSYSKLELTETNQSFQNTVHTFRNYAKNILTLHKRYLNEQSRALGREALVYGRQIKNFVLKQEESKLEKHAATALLAKKDMIANLKQSMSAATQGQIAISKQQLQVFKEKADQLNPQNVLKRGFSITRSKGKAIRHAERLREGEELHTSLYQGNILSKVIKEKSNNHEK
jgi:exodeoxyribonuclease VII large subunit